MPISTDDDKRLEKALAGPLLDVPNGFSAQVMAALPARTLRSEARPKARRAWRVLQAAVLAVCGTLGAVEVLFFVSGLWAATAVAVG